MNDSTQSNFYVGTYTDGASEGIYEYALDESGKFQNLGLVAKTSNPSFLTMNGAKDVLLAVNENEDGGVTSFAINGDSLEQRSKQSSGGGSPCYISVNQDGFILTANYGTGTLGLLQLGSDGKLSSLLDKEQHEGKGVTDRQEGPHAHSAIFLEEDQVISADLGTDELWFYKLNTEAKKLEPEEPRKIALQNGAGPRHIAFNPDGESFYVLNELNNTVTRFIRENAGYIKKESLSTLDENFNGSSSAADIHCSSDGKFLYVSNRGEDSIAVFKIADDGSLENKSTFSVHGKHPRNFKLSPDEKFVIVANRDTNNIVSFKRDVESGSLEYVGEIEAPKPVCILFK